jgi:DNA-binding CsgD family transcriptional regulator
MAWVDTGSVDRRPPEVGVSNDAGGVSPAFASLRVLADWLDEERSARMIVNDRNEVLWLSQAALQMVGREGVFTICAGQLVGAPPGLPALIAQLLAPGAPVSPVCLVIEGQGESWIVWARRIAGEAQNAVGLTFRRRGANEFRALADTHALTPTEARILDLMLAGRETGAIARALHISIETLRTHLKNVYRKLHVSSRGELFAEAADFAAP